MESSLKYMADYADDEFDGRSYDGPSLMATLSCLDAAQAASESTFEGYSAWSVALHLAYCKWLLADGMLDEAGRSALGPYPWPRGESGFARPADSGAEAWAAVLAYLPRAHGAAMAAIRGLAPADLEREFEAWKIPLGKAVAWLCGHDAYHAAQIRSMGIPGLRGKRMY
jgi:hypothetical protein